MAAADLQRAVARASDAGALQAGRNGATIGIAFGAAGRVFSGERGEGVDLRVAAGQLLLRGAQGVRSLGGMEERAKAQAQQKKRHSHDKRQHVAVAASGAGGREQEDGDEVTGVYETEGTTTDSVDVDVETDPPSALLGDTMPLCASVLAWRDRGMKSTDGNANVDGIADDAEDKNKDKGEWGAAEVWVARRMSGRLLLEWSQA